MHDAFDQYDFIDRFGNVVDVFIVQSLGNRRGRTFVTRQNEDWRQTAIANFFDQLFAIDVRQAPIDQKAAPTPLHTTNYCAPYAA